jgi:hypothetical protein
LDFDGGRIKSDTDLCVDCIGDFSLVEDEKSESSLDFDSGTIPFGKDFCVDCIGDLSLVEDEESESW